MNVGYPVGAAVGTDVVGLGVGLSEGLRVGEAVGDTDGILVGAAEGTAVGIADGSNDGDSDGAGGGYVVGNTVGDIVGFAVVVPVGENVTHTFAAQLPRRQSASITHDSPISHPWHKSPPQSTSVSFPFFIPSMHSAAVGPAVGIAVGWKDGTGVGTSVGNAVGSTVAMLLQHRIDSSSLSQLKATLTHITIQHIASSDPDTSTVAVKGSSSTSTTKASS